MHEPDAVDPAQGQDLLERHERTLGRPRFDSLAVREPGDLLEMHEPDIEVPDGGTVGSGTVASMPLMQIPTREVPRSVETVRPTQIQRVAATLAAIARRVHAGHADPSRESAGGPLGAAFGRRIGTAAALALAVLTTVAVSAPVAAADPGTLTGSFVAPTNGRDANQSAWRPATVGTEVGGPGRAQLGAR